MIPRLAIYGAVSTSLAGMVITSAVKSRPNFYSAAVALGRSSASLMVLANFALFNAICVGVVFKSIFFGRLRAIEYEHLFERLWLFLTESLLALTIFRDDFSIPFAFMYGMLLFLKCFHWITADRVDFMDQIPPPGPPTLFHIRIILVTAFLALADFILVLYSLETILLDGVSAMVLFASEFMILSASIWGTSARYAVGLIDLRRARGREDAPSWEEKSMWLFYVDLAVDFVKLLTYLLFFAVILLHYGLPLHILRDVYMTLRSFLSRVSDLIRYRRATRDMDALYPNATSEDMERTGDRTCIICREEMIVSGTAGAGSEINGNGGAAVGNRDGGPNETPKKLSCGHVFHFHCLRSWLERQQSCPTCRRDVLRTPAPTGRRRGPLPAQAPQQQQPPPAAPGAVPQLHGNANPGGAGGAVAPPVVNPIQALYDQYFRQPPPAVQPQATAPPLPRARPTPVAQGAIQDVNHGAPLPTQGEILPNATGQMNGHANQTGNAGPSAPISSTTETSNGVDSSRRSTGIWGQQVTPGKFFPLPLGATSRTGNQSWPSIVGQGSTEPTTMPNGTPPQIHRSNSLGRTAQHQHQHQPTGLQASGSTSTSTPPDERLNDSTTARPRISTSTGSESSYDSENERITRRNEGNVSGTVTPHVSQAPQIFTSPGDVRPTTAGDNHMKARKAAAEAAMRRFGLPSTLSTSAVSPVEPAVVSADAPQNEAVTTISLPVPSAKGKEKAVSSPPEDLHPLDHQPIHIPYLSSYPSNDSGINGINGVGNGVAIGRNVPWGNMPTNMVDAREGLAERIRRLRDVDERVWGLVGEMTEMISRWEVEDEESRVQRDER